MGKFRSRVGRVSIRDRAIVICLFLWTLKEDAKTLDIAAHLGIGARRALTVLSYARAQGWLYSVEVVHRGNSFAYVWGLLWYQERQMRRDTSIHERFIAHRKCTAYHWGKRAQF